MKAHKYNLRVKWSNNRPDWNINILSVNTENISTWLPTQETEEDYIISVNIELIERNVEEARGYIAKGID